MKVSAGSGPDIRDHISKWQFLSFTRKYTLSRRIYYSIVFMYSIVRWLRMSDMGGTVACHQFWGYWCWMVGDQGFVHSAQAIQGWTHTSTSYQPKEILQKTIQVGANPPPPPPCLGPPPWQRAPRCRLPRSQRWRRMRTSGVVSTLPGKQSHHIL